MGGSDKYMATVRIQGPDELEAGLIAAGII